MVGRNKTWAIFMVCLLVVTWVAGDVSLSWADNRGSSKPGRTELRARGEAPVNGIEAELNGKFRNETTKNRQRLQGELENINLAVGTDITFCLVQGNTTTLLATEPIVLENLVNVAEFGLDTQNLDTVPAVVAGNVLQAFQGTSCSGTLLVSATF